METDRHATDGEDRRGEPAADDSTETDGPSTPGRETAHTTPPETAPSRPGADAHEYGYGEDPLAAAGTDGPRAADSGSAAPSDPAAAPEGSTGPDGDAAPAPAEDPATGTHSATGLRSATAPRAVLRPIPEGFPTPPPRPARPNRRPAPKPDPAAEPRRPRPLLIVGIAAAAALLLVVVVGGGLLAIRALSPAEEPAAPAASEGQDPSGSADAGESGSVDIGGVVVTEVSTEVGVRAVGDSGSRIEPEGEFVIVTFEVENPTTTGVQIGGDLGLESADEVFPVDEEATRAHEAESAAFSVVPPDGSNTFHAVFDVPIGTDPTGMVLDLVQIGESGTLPLDG